LAFCIKPPSISALRERLQKRGTETEESFRKRLGKAENELTFAEQFDIIIVNDQLEHACAEADRIVLEFIENQPQ
jgi:guanylate kinase